MTTTRLVLAVAALLATATLASAAGSDAVMQAVSACCAALADCCEPAMDCCP